MEAKNTKLENRCTKLESEKTEEGRLIQIIEEGLQSSKTTLQWSYAIVGAILSGGLVLTFPPAGAAIALSGTGSVAAGAAVAGGAAGGYIVAPIVHKKTHKEAIQQVQNFKAKQEVSKKVE